MMLRRKMPRLAGRLDNCSVPGILSQVWGRRLCSVPWLLGGVAALFVISGQAQCGVYLSAGANWNNFAFEPENIESTPNYYGYGARVSTGYSIRNNFDLGIYGQYTPGKLSAAEFNREDSRLWHGGAELAGRFARIMYIGARAGMATYRLVNRNNDLEVGGTWTGQVVEGSLGLLLPEGKESSWQLTLDLSQATVKPKFDEETTQSQRKISAISLTLSFVYNGLLKDFLESRLL